MVAPRRAALAWAIFVIAAGCGGEDDSPATPAPAPSPAARAEVAPTPSPAFVLYASGQTVLLPLDGSTPVVGSGLWVYDDREEAVLVHRGAIGEAALAALPTCACPDQDRGCGEGPEATRHFDAETYARAADESPLECACRQDSSIESTTREAVERAALANRWPDDPPLPPLEDDDDDEYEEEYDEDCQGDDESELVSIFGGVAFALGWSWNGACNGALSIYDAYSEDSALIEDPPALPEGMELVAIGCDEDLSPGMVNELFTAGPDDGLCPPASDDDDENDDDGCSSCNEYSAETGEVLYLARGFVYAVEDNMFHAGAMRWIARGPARPSTCPSSADPCGDPSAFPFLASLPVSSDFWVASDGAAALVGDDEGFVIHRRGVEAPSGSLASDMAGDVVGVRYHADATALREVMSRRRSPAVQVQALPTPGARCSSTDECEGGQRCEDGACWAPCQSNADCESRGVCAGRCSEGACLPPGRCATDEHCLDDDVCDEGRCGLPSRLAETDRDFVDPQQGRGWGNRCWTHFEAGRLSHARAACERGLRASPTPATRGALLYNLGRIAEARGRTSDARARYRGSLEVRPGNTTVQARLDSLGAR